MYGLVASVTSVISGTLLQSGSLKLEGPWIASPYVQAFVIGVSVRAVLHINLFTLTSGKTTTPIGFETFTRFFEAGLLRDMKFFEFIQIDGYLAGYANRFTIDEAKARARANVPATLAAEERDAFVVDVEKASAVRDVMEVFLRFAGQRPFEYAYK
jgi:hypothetical protein